MVAQAESRAQTGRLIARVNILLPGLYAWVITVGTPATSHSAPALARVLALLALVALLVGPWLVLERPRLGRSIGLLLYMGLCVATWLLLSAELQIEQIDRVQAALGGVGWAVFAFGWGAVRHVGSVPEDHPNVISGSPLPVRSELPKGTVVILGIGAFGALACMLLAWREQRPEHALLTHAVALACAVALLSAASRIAVVRGRGKPPRHAIERLHRARHWLALLLVLFGLSFVWMLLR